MNEVGVYKNDLDTPVMWVDLDLVESNIKWAAGYFRKAGIHWRPHIKGNKVPALAHKVIDAGAIGVTCAKLGEAEVMAASGIKDILVANELIGQQKITRLVNLRKHADVMVCVDSPGNVEQLSAAAVEKGVELRVLVEVRLNMHRCGVEPGEPAVDLSRKVHRSPGLRYMGVMGYEGQAMDFNLTVEERTAACEEAIGRLTKSAQLCRDADLPVEIVSGGASFDYPIYSHFPGVTEIQAGGLIFNDVTYRTFGVETQCSLFVLATVISRHDSWAVVDAGRKAMNGDTRMPEVVGREGIRLVELHAEHGILKLEHDDIRLEIGDKIDFIVGYGDNNLFLHDQLYGVRNGQVETVWEIAARGKLR